MFEKNVVTKKADNAIAETGRTQSSGNRMVKSIELSEDDKDYRSVKTIELVRDNQNSGRRKCNEGQLENRSNIRHGRKKYNLRSRGSTNHDVDLQTVNAVDAESSSHIKAGDWNCISNHPPAAFHNYSYVLGDHQKYSQQPTLYHISPTGFQYGLTGRNSCYPYEMHNVPNAVLYGNPYEI